MTHSDHRRDKGIYTQYIPTPLPEQLIIFGLGIWPSQVGELEVEIALTYKDENLRLGMLTEQTRYKQWFMKYEWFFFNHLYVHLKLFFIKVVTVRLAHQTAQWLEHLTKDSGGPGLNPGLVRHYFSHPATKEKPHHREQMVGHCPTPTTTPPHPQSPNGRVPVWYNFIYQT